MKNMSILRKVCFIVNYNMYESKRYFTEKLGEALQKKGVDVMTFDVQEGILTPEVVSSIVGFKPDLTCSFNTLLNIEKNRFLSDLIKTPHWSILLDPVLYSTNIIESPYSLISCVDRNDCALLKSSGFDRGFFFPHAVEKELIGKGSKDKTIDVVFLGSCYDYESLRISWRQQNNDSINAVLDDAIDLVFSDNKTSLAEALTLAFRASKLSLEGVDFASLFYYLDNYTRGKDRVELIRAIKDVPVHVYGALSQDNAVGMLGWSPYLAGCKNVTVHPSVNFAEGLEILKHAKIALNSMPFFKNGSHERVLTALSCGALPITTDTLYFRECFKEKEEVVFYSSKALNLVNDMAVEYIKDEAARQRIVNQGALVVAKDFTWDVRAEQLLKTLPELLTKM